VTSGATLDSSHVHAGRVHVRTATEEDLPDLLRLWNEMESTSGRNMRDVLHLGMTDVRSRLLDALHHPLHRVIVATTGNQVHGMAVLSRTSLGPLSTAFAVQLSHVIVAGGHRRSGIGHALLAGATAYADDIGAEHVMVGVAPMLRDANRFYARLGFSPVLVRRMTSVALLRRRLTDSEHPVAAVEELARRRLIARPRLARSRTSSGRGWRR
jgi:GNAT superfamily N-acetyltransferase